MRTPRLPVVDRTDAPADLNGLVLFAGRRNLVSARVTSHFNLPLRMHVIHTPSHNVFAYHAGEHSLSTYSRTPLIRTLVIRIANYPGRLALLGKYVENSTKLTCLDLALIGSSTMDQVQWIK